MKKNKYIGIMMLAATMLTAASCTDYNDYNTVPEESLPIANSTLWENIASDQQLTKFAELAQKSKFSEVLNSPRFYTVWAPVDEAFNDEDYNKLLASDSATIVNQFMHQHITEYNYPVSAALDSITIVSLNAKHHPFTKEEFDGLTYNATNIPSTNGVMHKINGYSEFRNNLYQNIDFLTDCDSIQKYIQKYDVFELDRRNSIIGPIVEGKQTYLDSVMMKSNSVINDIMKVNLENEDSTYCMLIPNDKAWKGSYETISPNYKYLPEIKYTDLSLKSATAQELKVSSDASVALTVTDDPSKYQDSLTCHYLIRDLVFSKNYQRNSPIFDNGTFADKDSAYTTTQHYLTNMQEVLSYTKEISENSNGIVRIVDSLAYNPEETYNPLILTSVPKSMLDVKNDKLTTHNIPLADLSKRDTLFSKVPAMIKQWLFPAKSRYFSYVAVDSADIDGTSAKPEFDFALRNVRSTTYHIYVVTVPAQVEKATAAVKSYYLRFYLSWTNEKNEQQKTVLPKGARTNSKISTDNGKNTNTVTYYGDPGRVNVIDLGEFTFPVSYDGLEAYPSLMMMHTESYTSASNKRKYDQQMRIAGVYLVPKEYNDQWVNSDDNE